MRLLAAVVMTMSDAGIPPISTSLDYLLKNDMPVFFVFFFRLSNKRGKTTVDKLDCLRIYINMTTI